ncbi:MAG: hypothetical protein AABW85_00460 [archaeon]
MNVSTIWLGFFHSARFKKSASSIESAFFLNFFKRTANEFLNACVG